MDYYDIIANWSLTPKLDNINFQIIKYTSPQLLLKFFRCYAWLCLQNNIRTINSLAKSDEQIISSLTTISERLNLLERLREYLSDIGKIDFVEDQPPVSPIKRGEVFIDNMIFVDILGDKSAHRGTEMKVILDSFKTIDTLNNVETSICNFGKIQRVKVSFRSCNIDAVITTLKSSIDMLRRKGVGLSDVDITQDFNGVSNRSHMSDFLVNTIGISEKHIVKDKDKTGNDCISWTELLNTDGYQDVIKIYNKILQLLSGGKIGVKLGCNTPLIVTDGFPFLDKVEQSKDLGYSRLEIKTYTNKVHDLSWYKNKMDVAYDKYVNDSTPLIQLSYKDMWKKIVNILTSCLAIYFPDEEILIFCQWYNSVTNKYVGRENKNIRQENVINIIANFSFNNIPTYYFEYKKNKEVYVNTIAKIYRRDKDCIHYTMVPGKKGSFYSSYENYIGRCLSWNKLGFDNDCNVAIDWPITRLRPSTKNNIKLNNLILPDN